MKYLLIILIILSTIAIATNFLSHLTTQQETHLIVGVVTLECVVRGEDVVVILKNTQGREFIVVGVETVPRKTVSIFLPHTLRPENTTYLLLGGVGGLSSVSVLLVDPETNTSLIMTCSP